MRAHLLRLAAAAAALATAACTGTVEGTGTSIGTGGPAVLDRAVALAPDAHHADLATGLSVAADGTVLVSTVGGPDGRSALRVVHLPGDGTATAGDGVALDDVELDLALTAGGEVLVVGRDGASSGGDSGVDYGVLVVDPSSGAVLDVRRVAGTEGASGFEAVALPDGTVVVAGVRSGGAPFLLRVDPATGAVLASAEVDVAAVPGERTIVRALAVSPDGSRIAVGLAVGTGGSWTPVVAGVDAALSATAAAQALDGGAVTALAVADDGTAYAALEDAAGILAVDPAAGAVRQVDADLAEVTALAVVGDELVAVDRGLVVTRLDPADGAVSGTVDLCTDTGAAAGIGVAPDGSLVVAANCAGAGLWVLPA